MECCVNAWQLAITTKQRDAKTSVNKVSSSAVVPVDIQVLTLFDLSLVPQASIRTQESPASYKHPLSSNLLEKPLMILTPLLYLTIASLAPSAFSQIRYDSEHNATSIVGTWSSGSKQVLTGPGFANPANKTFSYPLTTGISYSFSEDGFYEISRYRFNGNGSEPTCITGVINWVHGKYALNGNGSMTLTPFGDGYQQIQDPCAAVSNFLEDYNLTEYYTQWRIFQDPVTGFKLHMFQFDGAPLAPQFQISTTPNMLPTRLLRNVTTPTTPAGNGVKTPTRRSLLEKKSNDASTSQLTLAFGATIVMVTSSVAALFL